MMVSAPQPNKHKSPLKNHIHPIHSSQQTTSYFRKSPSRSSTKSRQKLFDIVIRKSPSGHACTLRPSVEKTMYDKTSENNASPHTLFSAQPYHNSSSKRAHIPPAVHTRACVILHKQAGLSPSSSARGL